MHPNEAETEALPQLLNGSFAFVGVIPGFDAIVVERLLDAGAVTIGKLNQDDFAASGSLDTSVFGPARRHSPRATARFAAPGLTSFPP
jgi:Asp-tRNA(Asn)/Glu-tRNA(Gln) amidotransferase A subunit family amidase